MAEINPTEEAIADIAAANGDPNAIPVKEDVNAPSYKMIGSAKIPVSKHTGSLWKGRKEATNKKMRHEIERWKEAVRYFDNDQYFHRTPREGSSSNIDVSMRRNKIHSETENIVYANIMAMVPALYAKNPNGEMTGYNNNDEQILRIGERLIKALCAMKVAPGFNLRSKIRRCVVSTLLMNEAWITYGYTQKEDSSEQMISDLNEIGSKLEKAKDTKEIMELEGQLMALEESSDFLQPPGPLLKVLMGPDVLTDPDGCEDDLSDSKWIMYPLFIPTSYIRAKYGKKGEDDQYYSIYQPTNVLDPKGDSKNSEHDGFDTMSLFEQQKEHAAYGFDSKEAFDRSCYTKVWYVWDRVTRRLYMFNDAEWSWPIWVFNDPYGLPGFFPIKKLTFNAHPYKLRNRGEVSYYLDQQDAINDINDETNRIRKHLKFKLIYDKNVLKDGSTLETFFDNDTQKSFGVDLAEGKKMGDLFIAPPFPALQFKEFFEKDKLYSAIDRVAGVSEIMRGAQFKTNTTNKAVDVYNSLINQKLDEKIDAIEEFVGDVLADILFLCLKFMSPEEVVRIIGGEVETAQAWTQLQQLTERKMISYRVVGGSTQKPTSAAKKKEALEMAQVLGQYVQASPVVVVVMLKMMEKAFDDIVITAEDWQMIMKSLMQQLQGDQEQPQEPDPSQDVGGAKMEEIVQKMKERGIPEDIARKKVREKLEGAGSNGNARPQ